MGAAWDDITRCYDTLTRELAARGLPVRSPLVRAEGLLSAWRDGAVYIAPVSLDAPGDALRATIHASMMGVGVDEVVWLYRALAPRLIGHELGHALRGERGLLSDDHLVEEQIAERLGAIFMRAHVTPRDRRAARAMLGAVSVRLGGVAEAAALHRHAPIARERLGLRADARATAATAEAVQRDYYTDVTAYLRLCVAWAWIDLSLDADGSIEDFARAHLTRADARHPEGARRAMG